MPQTRGRALLAVSTGAAAVLALSLLGSLLAPDRGRAGRAPQAAGVTPEVPLPGVADPVAPGEPARTELSVEVADTTLGATVVSPATPGPHPGVVLVAGGGTGVRAGLLDDAEQFARRGIVAAVYDKRRTGYSWTRRDYGRLADDALAVLAELRRRSDVDPARAGLWGVSEGGWVVPIAASRSADVTFAVLVSAPGVTPGAQVAWAVDEGLRSRGAPAGARRVAVRALSVGGPAYSHHDPVPALRAMRQPALVIYGSDDRAVPVEQSARIMLGNLGGEHRIRFFADADHGLRTAGAPAPGYFATMAAWITGLPASATAGPPAAGRPPGPVAASEPIEIPWYGRPAAILGLLGLAAAGFVVAAVALRRSQHRSGGLPREARRSLAVMSVAGVVTAVLVNVTVGGLIALGSARGPGWAADLLWATVRLSALAAVALTVRAGFQMAAAPDRTPRTAVAAAFGASGVVALISAYWGLFAPSW